MFDYDCGPDFDMDFDDYYPEGIDDDRDYDMSDVEADADTLASAGYGMDEDYGFSAFESDF